MADQNTDLQQTQAPVAAPPAPTDNTPQPTTDIPQVVLPVLASSTQPYADELFPSQNAQSTPALSADGQQPYADEIFSTTPQHEQEAAQKSHDYQVYKDYEKYSYPIIGSIIRGTGELASTVEEGFKSSIKSDKRLAANLIAPFLSDQQLNDLKQSGDYQTSFDPSQVNLDKDASRLQKGAAYIGNSIMQSPVGQLANAAFGGLLSPFAPVFDSAMKAMHSVGVGQGYLDFAVGALTVSGFHMANEVTGTAGKDFTPPQKEAIATHAAGVPEDVYMGTRGPSDGQSSVAKSFTTPEAEPVPQPDIHEAVRTLAPETFQKYDALDAEQERLRAQLAAEADNRQHAHESESPHAQEDIDALRDKIKGANKKNTKIYQARIDEMEAANEEHRANAPTEDTPEMEAIRDQIQQLDYQKRDLAPDVTDAYAKAREQYPEPEEAPETAQEQPQEEAAASETTAENSNEVTPQAEESVTTKPIEEQKVAIVADTKQKLMAAGRPEAEAEAAAQLMAEHYQARSERFGGKRGTAEELYQESSPEIRKGREVKKRVRELAQKNGRELNQLGEIEMLHGSKSESITQADATKQGSNTDAGNMGSGFYSSPSSAVARNYGKNVHKVKVRLDNALEFVRDEKYKESIGEKAKELGVKSEPKWNGSKQISKEFADEFRDKAMEAGYDGAVSRAPNDARDIVEAVAYEPDQVNFSQARELNQSASNTDTTEFKNWFGDSKIVNAEGRPQVVYHGTDKNFAAFNPKKGAQQIIWFTSEKADILAGEVGAAGQGRIIEMFAKIEKPAGWKEYDNLTLNELEARGYDGVILLNKDGTFVGFGFEPTQFKDVKNKGMFNINDKRLLHQKAQGKIRLATDDAKATITLMKTANASTFIHETGHAWFEELVADAKHPDAPAQMKSDAAALLKYANADEEGNIPTRGHEKVARSFERYLMEGVAPSKSLARVFAQFKTWLTKIYQTVDRLKAPITDDIRAVFDRMLSSDPEKTIIAPDHEPGARLADIHEEEAMSTSPEHAATARDAIEREIDYTAKLHDSEVSDALEAAKESVTNPSAAAGPAAEAGSEREAAPGAPTAPTAPTGADGAEPTGTRPSEAGANQEPNPVAAVGSDTGTEGGDIQPAAGEVATNPTNATAGGAERPVSAAESAATDARTSDTGIESKAAGDAGAGKYPSTPSQKFRGAGKGVVDKAGNIRLDLLNTTEDVNVAIREMAEENGNFLTNRRGIITNGQSLDLADALGMNPTLLDMRKIGQAFNAEEIVASTKMLIQAAADVSEAARKGDKEAYLEARERQKMIQGHVSGTTAEAGRALQIFKALNKIEGYDQAKTMSEFLKQIDNGKDLFQLEKEMEFAAKLNTPQQLAKFIEDSKKAKFKDAILQYYINALLSGPITHARYAVGNAVNAIWHPLVEIPIAAGFGAAREAITGEKIPDRVYLGEARAQLYGMMKGSSDGLTAAIEAWKTGMSPALPGERVAEQFTQHQNAIPGKVGEIINVPSKSVSAIHSFFKSLRYEQEIAGMAYRNAMKEGLEGDAVAAKISDLTTSPTPEMMDMATRTALKELYMAPTEYHSFMGAISRATNENLLAKIMVPFAKVGGEITKNAWLERTPLGFADKTIRANLMGLNGDVARDMQAAKITAGVALMSTSLLLAAQGMLTGDGPEDPKQRATWLLTHSPNSITIGGMTMRYQGLGPLGMLMRFTANMHETAAGWDGKDGDKLAVSFLEGITKSVLDENFMRGVKDTLDAIYHPQEYGQRYLQGLVTNWIPFSVGLGQTAREIDPYSREAHTIMQNARAKIPFLSEYLMPRRDMFGNPIKNGSTYDQYKSDPVVQRMEALGTGIGRLERKINNVPLTDQQYDDYARVAGKITKMMLDTLIRPGFEYQPPGIQIQQITQAQEHAREYARNVVKYAPGNQNIMQQATENKKAIFKK